MSYINKRMRPYRQRPRFASPSFTSHNQPFPIILGNTITSQDNSSMFMEPDGFVPLQNLIYEFNACG